MERLKEYFLENIGKDRWEHSLRVLDTALELRDIYGGDRDKLVTAALLHDCAKISDRSLLLKKAASFDIILDELMLYNKELIHGPLGARIAEEDFHIKDREILDAIQYHTTGRRAMTDLDKLIFIADIIEPERNFPGVEEIRELAYRDLDRSIVLSMDKTLVFLMEKDKLISLDTIEARNYLKIKIMDREGVGNG